MKSLYQYIVEGGASGHMHHPFDYTDFTLRDLKGLIRNLFTGKIEDITEKVDGTNIQATINQAGEVRFIRNKGDLNNPDGGMTIGDMANKWADKPSVAKTFIEAGETITKVFSTLSYKLFNPDPDTKITVNCECVVAGKTNIMPYVSAQVDFHDFWVYKKNSDGEWEHTDTTKKWMSTLQKACDNIDAAHPTPQVVIKVADESNKILVDYIKRLDKLFKEAGCKEMDTVDTWKRQRFDMWCEKHDPWILDDEGGKDILYKRWFEGDKSTNIKQVKQIYNSHIDRLVELEKTGYKEIASDVMEPLDIFFLDLGNKIIDLCDDIINSGQEDQVCTQLRQDLEDVVADVRANGSIAANAKLTKQLNRLAELGEKVNPVEGIVFKYKNKLMKLTGSFAPINQILGSIKFSR